MHELSIAMSIIDLACEEAERLDTAIVAVHLRLGPLSGVVPESLESAYELAREHSPLADARLIIQRMPIVAWCEHCQSRQTIKSVQLLCCPVCHRPTPDIISGRELQISALEVMDESTNTHGASPTAGAQT